MLQPEKNKHTQMIITHVRNACVQMQTSRALRETCKQNIMTDSTREQEHRKTAPSHIGQERLVTADMHVVRTQHSVNTLGNANDDCASKLTAITKKVSCTPGARMASWCQKRSQWPQGIKKRCQPQRVPEHSSAKLLKQHTNASCVPYGAFTKQTVCLPGESKTLA